MMQINKIDFGRGKLTDWKFFFVDWGWNISFNFLSRLFLARCSRLAALRVLTAFRTTLAAPRPLRGHVPLGATTEIVILLLAHNISGHLASRASTLPIGWFFSTVQHDIIWLAWDIPPTSGPRSSIFFIFRFVPWTPPFGILILTTAHSIIDGNKYYYLIYVVIDGYYSINNANAADYIPA